MVPMKSKKDTINVGRPSKYENKYDLQAYKLCLLGATDRQLGDFFGVSEQTINAWKKAYSSFLESIRAGKDIADAEVANSLFKRAKGYSHAEDKVFNDQGIPMVVPTIKRYPPDTHAATFWLKNRQKAKWREGYEVTIKPDEDKTEEELKAELAVLLEGRKDES